MLINEVKSKVLPFKVHISEFSLSSLHLRGTPHSLLVAFVQRQLIFSPNDTVYREKPPCLHSPITRWIMCLYESEVIPSWFLTLLRGVIKTSDTLSAMGSDRLWLIRSLFPIDSLPASAVKPAHPKAETPGLPRPCGNQPKWGPGNFLTPTALLWSRKMKLLLCLLRMNQADGAATCNLEMCALPPRDSAMLLSWGPGCFSSTLHCPSAAFSLKWKRGGGQEGKHCVTVKWWICFLFLVQMFTSLRVICKDSLIPGCGWEGAVDGEFGIGSNSRQLQYGTRQHQIRKLSKEIYKSQCINMLQTREWPSGCFFPR